MKIGTLVDLHFEGANHVRNAEILGRNLASMKDRGVELVLVGGDFYHAGTVADKVVAYPATVHRALAHPFEQFGKPVVGIPGNHDEAAGGNDHATALFGGHRLVRIVDRPRVVRWGEVAIACLPWASKGQFLAAHQHLAPGEAQEAFHRASLGVLDHLRRELEAKPAAFSILLFHSEVVGAEGDTGGYVFPGSTFYFSGADLAGVGANLAIGGHYHRRQRIYSEGGREGWFAGAFNRRTMGERDNPTGWFYCDTERGEWEPVDVSGTRFVVVSRAEDYRPEDLVDAEVDVRTPELPANILPHHRHRPPAEVRAARPPRVEGVSDELDPVALLELWGQAAGETLDMALLEPLLAELLRLPALAEALRARGSFEDLLELELSGFGTHSDTLIDFSAGDWWAVSGPTGSGKTLLLEAVGLALYGTWPQKDRDLWDAVCGTTARVRMDWISNGLRYRVDRRLYYTGKTRNHDPMFYVEDAAAESGWRTLAGPDVDSVKKEIEKVVGSRALFLATVLLSQESEGDLLGAGKTARQDVMAAYLDLERWALFALATKQKADHEERVLGADDRQLEDLPRLRDLLPAAAAAEKEAAQAVVTAAQDVERRERELREAEDAQRAIEARASARAELEQKVADAEKLLEGAKASQTAALEKVKELRGRLEAEPELRERMQRAEPCKLELEELEAQRHAYQEAQTARERLVGTLNAKEAEGGTAALAVKKAERELAHAKDLLARAERDHERETERLRKRVEQLREAGAVLDRVGCTSAALYSRMSCYGLDHNEGIGDFLEASTPLPCPLIDGARQGLVEAEKLEAQIAAAEEAAFEGTVGKQELEAVTKATAELEAEKAKKEKLADAWRAAKADLDAYQLPAGPDPRRVQELTKEAEDLVAVGQELARLEEVSAQLEATDQLLPDFQEDVFTAIGVVQRAKDALAAQADVATELEAARKVVANASEELRGARAYADSRAVAKGAATRDLERTSAELEKLEELERKSAERRARLAGWRQLERAFGRTGIPQLLISVALPGIQEELDRLAATYFADAYQVDLDTQSTTQTGKVREDFAIILRKPGVRPYDAKMGSGGEKALVRTMLRVAMATWRHRNGGGRFSVLGLDEVTAGMSPEVATATIRMLAELHGVVHKVILISHRDADLAPIPNRIHVEPVSPARSSVRVQAGGLVHQHQHPPQAV